MAGLWGTDGKISLPVPSPNDVLIKLGDSGFVFTNGGIAHDVTEADLEEIATPGFIPPPELPQTSTGGR